MAKPIDYDKTLILAFDETIKYLTGLKSRTGDKKALADINYAINAVKKVRENPAKYVDYNARVRDDVDSHNAKIVIGFVPTPTSDNTVLRAYSAILNSMENLNSDLSYPREQAQQALLKALKTIKYKNANALLRDFTFPFRSPKSFAVKANQDQR